MTDFDFQATLAVDPTDPSRAVAGATFVVVPEGATDVSAAIAVRDLTDVPISSLTSSSQGVVPAFRTTDVPSVVLICTTAGVAYRSPVFSGTGLLDAAREARDAALVAQGQALASASAAAALAASSAMPAGGSDGQVVTRQGGSLVWGPVARTAADLGFAPTGAVTATTVQGAIEQAAQLGSSGGTSNVMVVRRVSGAWPALPTARPDGVELVQFVGSAPLPTQSSWPSWVGLGDEQVPVSMQVTSS